jgi:hypothetical protein
MENDGFDPVLTRRDALTAGATVIGAASLPIPLFAAVPAHMIPDASMDLHVNGAVHRLIVDPRAALLDVRPSRFVRATIGRRLDYQLQSAMRERHRQVVSRVAD